MKCFPLKTSWQLELVLRGVYTKILKEKVVVN